MNFLSHRLFFETTDLKRFYFPTIKNRTYVSSEIKTSMTKNSLQVNVKCLILQFPLYGTLISSFCKDTQRVFPWKFVP